MTPIAIQADFERERHNSLTELLWMRHRHADSVVAASNSNGRCPENRGNSTAVQKSQGRTHRTTPDPSHRKSHQLGANPGFWRALVVSEPSQKWPLTRCFQTHPTLEHQD
jgi:hypothetical protein